MDFKGCSFMIYKYMDKYIFFAGLEMYITIIRGSMVVFHPKPMYVCEGEVGLPEIKEAIEICIKKAHEKKEEIKEFNDMLRVGEILSIMPKNFKYAGIKAPMKTIRENTEKLSVVPYTTISFLHSSDIPARGNAKFWRRRELDINISFDEFAEEIWKEFNYYKGNDYTNPDEK